MISFTYIVETREMKKLKKLILFSIVTVFLINCLAPGVSLAVKKETSTIKEDYNYYEEILKHPDVIIESDRILIFDYLVDEPLLDAMYNEKSESVFVLSTFKLVGKVVTTCCPISYVTGADPGGRIVRSLAKGLSNGNYKLKA